MVNNKYLEGSACPPCSSAPIVPSIDYEKVCPELLKNKKIGSLFTALLSVLYVKLVLIVPDKCSYQWTFILFFFAFFAVVELFARLLKQKKSAEAWFWAAVMLLPPMSGLVFHNEWYLSPFIGLLTHLSAAEFALNRLGGAAEMQAGALLPLDMLRAWFILPFSHFFKNVRVLLYGRKTKASPLKLKNFWWTVLGLAFALPLCLWAFSTLVQADGAFAYSMEKVTRWLEEYPIWEWFFNVVNPWLLFLYGFFWCWFYGLFYGAFHQKYNTNSIKSEYIYKKSEKLRIFPQQTILTVLALLCGVYLVFFCTQIQYFTMGFAGRLPQEYTAAEYAREGFFELVRIVMVNLAVLGIAAKFSMAPLRKNRWLKAFASLLCGSNLLFAVIAFSKLWLYISRFGITSKRVLASYAVCVIFVWSVLAIVTLFRPIKAVVLAVHFAAVLFCAFAFVDWAAVEKQVLPSQREPVQYVQIDHTKTD